MATCLCMALILVLANQWLTDQVASRQTPDEIIPVGVIQQMRASHSVNTDWATVPTFPTYFKRVHFNFSGYILAAAAFTDATATPSDRSGLLTGVRLFSQLCTLALLILVFAISRSLWGSGYALLAVCATLTAPLLFQDAHYARPEAFGTLLFTFCMWLALPGRRTSIRSDVIHLMALAMVCGFLVSIKVTYAAAALFGLPIGWRVHCMHSGHPSRRAIALGALVLILVVAGFAVGAPYAVREPRLYLDGITALAHQYHNGNPPDSLMNHSFIRQLGWISDYFVATLGLIVFPLHAIGYANRGTDPSRRLVLLTYLLALIATVIFFARQNVFFERNFSHLIPGFMIIAAGGTKWLVGKLAGNRVHYARAWIVALSIVILVVAWQLIPIGISKAVRYTFSAHGVRSIQARYQQLVAQTAKQVGATRVQGVGFASVFRDALPTNDHTPACILYSVIDYGDPWSQRFVSNLPAGYRIAAWDRSLFWKLPPSTLQVYQSPTHVFIYNPRDCEAAHG